MHKAKEIQKMVAGVDEMIILETGVNKNAKIFIPDDNLEVGKENKMAEIERGQYQHNGSGTAIILRKGFNYRQGRNLFNNPKEVTIIMQDKEGNKCIIAGIHADNGAARNK